METLFPQILFLGPLFGPLVLRIAAAIAFGLFAKHLYDDRAEIAAGPFPIVGKPGIVAAWVAVVVASLITLSLAAGFMTQLAAILGFVSAAKSALLVKRYPHIYPWSAIAYFLLAAICLVLIVTGAGAFALDLPY